MPYTQPTLAQARTALAARLQDGAQVRWIAAELDLYLREALRTWNAWTSFYRDRDTFTTTLAEPFYDLPTVLPTLRGYTVTTYEIVTALQYALLEPPTPGAWTGTDQFTLGQLYSAVARRRDQFLQDTGIVQTRTVTSYGAPPASGRLPLSEDVLLVRRAAWRPDGTQFQQPLLVSDDWSANHYTPAWPVSVAPPSAYSVSTVPPLTLQLLPPTSLPGTLDLVAVHRGLPITEGVDSLVGIPDDWTWVVKYGALADLLGGDGLALDPQRAAYCQLRWQQGIAQATTTPVVLAARRADLPILLGSLADADRYSPLWQLVPGVPRMLLLAGGNLVACWPPPGAPGGPWSITLDVVANMPVPTANSDVLQVSADVYDAVLDLAQHTALVKEGPGQIELAMGLLERAAATAGIRLALQQGSQPARGQALTQTQQDVHTVPRVPVPVEIE